MAVEVVQFGRRGCSISAAPLFNLSVSTVQFETVGGFIAGGIFTGYSDLRKGIEGLAAVVQGTLSLDPFNKSLYLFCGRRRDRIKGLLWEGDGFQFPFKWRNSEKKPLLKCCLVSKTTPQKNFNFFEKSLSFPF